MFNLDPISTTNLFTVVQIIVVILGFYFSWRSLEATRRSVDLAAKNLTLGTNNAQAQLFNQMVIQGRDLQFRFVDIFISGTTDEKIKQRQDHFIGTLLGYYSSCFELRKVLNLPENIGKLLDADLSELMREDQVREKWNKIKHLHSKEFISYVENVRGIA